MKSTGKGRKARKAAPDELGEVASELGKDMMSRLFSAMGKRGGPARAKVLTPEQRKKIARQGAMARWGKNKK